jgi:cell division protein FtsN
VAESHEPSYYEIALTNRQVIVAFVLLLTCILGAFFSGVWIGREATARAAQDQIVRNAPPPQGPQDGKSLDELEFFDAKNKNKKGADHKTAGDKSAGKPAETAEMQTAAAAAPAPAPTLADDLARRTPAAGKKTRTSPPPAPVEEVAEEPAPAPPPVPRAKPVPQPAAPAPAATVPARKGKNRDKTAAATTAPARAGRSATDAANAAGAKGAYVIQVFSSADKTQADRIRAKLAGSGQKAYLSPIERGGRTMYRVRIGPFRSRGDAQTVADKVRKGYKMDTWVTE